MIDFIANNEATRIINHYNERSLQDSITVSFLKKGSKLGLKRRIFKN